MTLRDTLQAARRRVDSERGATITFALLVFMVCLILSAVILTAATASAGQFAELGQNDQRYYAVTSAAGLIADATKKSGSKLEVTQTVRGTFEDVRTEDATLTGVTPVSLSITGDDSTGILSALTSCAFVGNASGVNNVITLSPSAIKTDWASPWVKPFEQEDWDKNKGSEDDGEYAPSLDLFQEANKDDPTSVATHTFTITPTTSGMGSNAPSADDVTVYVDVRLWSDWTAEMAIYNAKVDENNEGKDIFSVYLRLAADMSNDEVVTETLGATQVDGVGAVTNSNTVTKTQTTTVKWHVEQLVSGRGLSDVTSS